VTRSAPKSPVRVSELHELTGIPHHTAPGPFAGTLAGISSSADRCPMTASPRSRRALVLRGTPPLANLPGKGHELSLHNCRICHPPCSPDGLRNVVLPVRRCTVLLRWQAQSRPSLVLALAAPAQLTPAVRPSMRHFPVAGPSGQPKAVGIAPSGSDLFVSSQVCTRATFRHRVTPLPLP